MCVWPACHYSNIQPEVIWGDGDGDAPCTHDSVKYWKSPEFFSWVYNESPVKDTVVINSRYVETVGLSLVLCVATVGAFLQLVTMLLVVTDSLLANYYSTSGRVASLFKRLRGVMIVLTVTRSIIPLL